MPKRSIANKREIYNQLINFFWTILCFIPVLWFWIKEGINRSFYLFAAISIIPAILPEKMMHVLMLSRTRKFYEKMAVKQVRKFVQNGDLIRAATGKLGLSIVKSVPQAHRYLKTISMYERYHWVCLIFFLLTTILCISEGHVMPGLLITVANILYNLSSILLQQYNKIRIRKIVG